MQDNDVVDVVARRRKLRAVSAQLRRAKHKSEIITLREQVDTLEAQLVSLQRTCVNTYWRECAIAEQRQRKKAEDDNMQLKEALTELHRNVLGSLPFGRLDGGINMRDLLHSYTHLPKDPHDRDGVYRTICSPSKRGLAYQIVMREARNRLPISPVVRVRQVPSRPGELALTVCTRFAVATTSIKKAFLAAGSAYCASNVRWAKFQQLHVRPSAREIPTLESRYGICEAQYRSESTGEIVLVEESDVTHWQLNESFGIFVRDFVDVDELHPLNQVLDARRFTNGVVVVQKELCPDGVERVICTAVCTKTFHFLKQGKPIVAIDTMEAVVAVANDMESTAIRTNKIILETVDDPPITIGLV